MQDAAAAEFLGERAARAVRAAMAPATDIVAPHVDAGD
jgi:hypothetical protein